MPRVKSLLNGEVSNVRGDIAREMIKLGVAEALDSLGPDTGENTSKLPKYNPTAVQEPSWEVTVHQGAQGAKVLVIRMTLNNGTYDYAGLPKDANRRREWPGGGLYLSGFGRAVPKEILKQYEKSYDANSELRGETLVRNATFRSDD
jgi:hypothetical protein